ncbi:MAG: DnaD domain protein, partial [Ruminococcus sp.]|nr:DnaD domain protein [Ruminococcus sp.]
LLKNNNTPVDDKQVSEALSMHPEDVKDCLSFWAERKVISINGEEITPQKCEAISGESLSVTAVVPQSEAKKAKRPVSRAVRPEPGYVIKRLGSDPQLMMLMDEAQRIFGRMLSNAEAGTLVMLMDTDGLPVDVIIMLLQYCVDNNKGTMRFVEKIGIEWGSEGINTVSLAEEKIRTVTETYSYFNKVASTFGMKNVGSPTKKQLTLANQWVGTWSFSDDMLRLAYERCVDTKGELNMDYINGILKKWYMAGWKNPDDVTADTAKIEKPKAKSAEKKSGRVKEEWESDVSYDIEAYEKKSIFD